MAYSVDTTAKPRRASSTNHHTVLTSHHQIKLFLDRTSLRHSIVYWKYNREFRQVLTDCKYSRRRALIRMKIAGQGSPILDGKLRTINILDQ